MPSIIVYYDGGCPLCSRTIRFHRRFCPQNAPVVWQDIRNDMAGLGIPFEEATQQFLVRDAEGRLQRGIDAFIVLWNALPPLKLLGRIAAFAPITSLLRLYYSLLAERHSKKHRQIPKNTTTQRQKQKKAGKK